MTYVLKRTNGRGGYVSYDGCASSYTSRLENAKRYPTKESAVADSCVDNEIPVRLEYRLQPVSR